MQSFKRFGHIQNTSDVSKDLLKCLSFLSAKNLDIIYVELTTPDLSELGFYVIKVLIPGMQDLNPDHKYPLFGGKRLYNVPKNIKYTDVGKSEDELNKLPHPFP